MKIIGIGNALTDVLVKLKDESLLQEMELPKGSMNLIEVDKRNYLLDRTEDIEIKITTGGSACNTLLALNELGVHTGFIGKVGNDHYGNFFSNIIRDAGIHSHFIHEEKPSGTAMVFISPDGERTFGTYLGVAAELSASDLKQDIFSQYTHLYAEGYLVQNHELIETAMKMAKNAGLKVALDLASYNVVEVEKDFLQHLIENYVDILFANEQEAEALTGKQPEEAIHIIGKTVDIAVVKVGKEGSYVLCNNELAHVPVEELPRVDTTAAGDYYAAGFFYGMEKECSMKECAQLGSLLAGEIIQVIGTKLSRTTWNRIHEVYKGLMFSV